MKKKIFKIEKIHDGQRLDVVLADLCFDLTRNQIQKLIKEGKVFVDGEINLSKKYKVREKDELLLELNEEIESLVLAENIELDIVYEDESLLVVNKPKGMVVHPGAGNDKGTLVNGLLFHYGDKLSGINGPIRPGIVHRLDKETSGLIVVAKDDESHKKLARQFEERKAVRVYKAIVHNNFIEDEGVVEEKIARDRKNRMKMRVVAEKGRDAKTHYKVLERFGDFTYIKLKLVTGRTHQIRVHMSYIKHPVLGDQLYGSKRNRLNLKSQALHAESLGFTHPSMGEYVEFSSPIPEYFKNALQILRK